MLPKRPEDYPDSYPIGIWYKELYDRVGEENLERLGFFPHERIVDRAYDLIAKQDKEFTNRLNYNFFTGKSTIYELEYADEVSYIATGNRRVIILNWFIQLADSKFAPALKELAKIPELELANIMSNSMRYHEFFELQLLVRDESIEWLNNNAFKWEVLNHQGFNYMLGYKYLLKMIREETHNILNYRKDFDDRRIAKYSQMVEKGDGAFLPCELLRNDLHYGGGKWMIKYQNVVDGDY